MTSNFYHSACSLTVRRARSAPWHKSVNILPQHAFEYSGLLSSSCSMCVHFQIFENSNRFPRNGYMPYGRSRLGVPNWFKLRGICVYAPKTVRFGPFWTKPSIPAFRAAPWLSIDTPNKTITQNLTVLWPLRKSTLVFWKRLVVTWRTINAP